jgi:type VI secretion system protein ImpK
MCARVPSPRDASAARVRHGGAFAGAFRMTAAFAPAPPAPAGAAHPPAVPRGRLAQTLQEALTAVVRLRAGSQQVPDAAAFRGQMNHLLARAEAEAQSLGYTTEDVGLAVFPVVALLDESALNAAQPALAEWSQRPLQVERYGALLAGNWFFDHIDQLLARPDSPALADVLEVYQLVLLLGFRGRFGVDSAGLQAYAVRVGERLRRLWGGELGPLAPAWRPPPDAIASHDPWIRRLAIALAASVALAVALWGAGALSLRAAAQDVAAASASARG